MPFLFGRLTRRCRAGQHCAPRRGGLPARREPRHEHCVRRALGVQPPTQSQGCAPLPLGRDATWLGFDTQVGRLTTRTNARAYRRFLFPVCIRCSKPDFLPCETARLCGAELRRCLSVMFGKCDAGLRSLSVHLCKASICARVSRVPDVPSVPQPV